MNSELITLLAILRNDERSDWVLEGTLGRGGGPRSPPGG
jgi:hypothetical protein